jgi:transposase
MIHSWPCARGSTEWHCANQWHGDLVALRAWLDEQRCPIVVIESPGGYWKPLYHVVMQTLEVVVANARSVRQRPGKKTDNADAAWLAELFAHGLVEPRFLPPPAVHAWRDLTRTRVALVQTLTRVQNRLSKVLEDTNIKVAHAMHRNRLDATASPSSRRTQKILRQYREYSDETRIPMHCRAFAWQHRMSQAETP